MATMTNMRNRTVVCATEQWFRFARADMQCTEDDEQRNREAKERDNATASVKRDTAEEFMNGHRNQTRGDETKDDRIKQ